MVGGVFCRRPRLRRGARVAVPQGRLPDQFFPDGLDALGLSTSLQTRAKPSIPLRKSHGSMATMIRICGVI
jgi:hypothetical protein